MKKLPSGYGLTLLYRNRSPAHVVRDLRRKTNFVASQSCEGLLSRSVRGRRFRPSQRNSGVHRRKMLYVKITLVAEVAVEHATSGAVCSAWGSLPLLFFDSDSSANRQNNFLVRGSVLAHTVALTTLT